MGGSKALGRWVRRFWDDYLNCLRSAISRQKISLLHFTWETASSLLSGTKTQTISEAMIPAMKIFLYCCPHGSYSQSKLQTSLCNLGLLFDISFLCVTLSTEDYRLFTCEVLQQAASQIQCWEFFQ